MTRRALLNQSLASPAAPASPGVWAMTLTIVGALFGASAGRTGSGRPR